MGEPESGVSSAYSPRTDLFLLPVIDLPLGISRDGTGHFAGYYTKGILLLCISSWMEWNLVSHLSPIQFLFSYFDCFLLSMLCY